MEIVMTLVLNVVLFAVGMLVLFYVVREAVRGGIALADRDRERRAAELAANEAEAARERDAVQRIVQARAEREASQP